MIIAESIAQVTTQGIGQVSKAKIAASSKLFSFFADQVYSNKYVAIWRELVANGIDAHKMAGKPDARVVVTLPTDYTPYAKVKDEGVGMSHEFMMDGFMNYTESTKTGSNEQIGGFGVGSKAPLSYTDQYAIHSIVDGVLNIYSVFKDETGCPAITHLGQSLIDAPNGVEISFPVEAKDIAAFRAAVQDTLEYFDPLPVLVNSAQQLMAPEYTVRTPTWGFRKGSETSRVIQGGIAYPLTQGATELEGFGLDFFVPIGSCSIALSRELLSYDDRTTRIVAAMVSAMRPDLEKYVSAMFDNCTTKWEAEALYAETVASGNPTRQALVRKHAFWKGNKLTGVFRRRSLPDGICGKLQIGLMTTDRYSKTSYGYWYSGIANPTVRAWLADIHPNDISMILIDDGAKKPVLRARRYLEENDISRRGVMILRPSTGAEVSRVEIARILVQLGRPPFKLLSEIEPAVVTRSVSTTKRPEKIRAYKSSSFNPPHRNDKFVDTLPVTGGYYMVMDNFVPLPGQATNDELSASSLKPDEVFWFNGGDFAKVKDNPLWKPAKVKYDEARAAYVKAHPNRVMAQAMNFFENQHYDYYSKNKYKLMLQLAKTLGDKCPKRGPLYQLMKMYNLVKSDLTYADASMRKLLKLDSSKELREITAQAQAATIAYPELWTLISNRNGSIDEELNSVYLKLI